jgi:hypothetical protein
VDDENTDDVTDNSTGNFSPTWSRGEPGAATSGEPIQPGRSEPVAELRTTSPGHVTETVRSAPSPGALIVAGCLAVMLFGWSVMAGDFGSSGGEGGGRSALEPGASVPATARIQQQLVLDADLYELDPQPCVFGPLLVTRPANWALGTSCNATTHMVHARFATTFSDNGVNAAWDSLPVAEVTYQALDTADVVAHTATLLAGTDTTVAGLGATRHEVRADPRRCADCTDGFGLEYLVSGPDASVFSVRLRLLIGPLIDPGLQRDVLAQFDEVIATGTAPIVRPVPPRDPFPGESGAGGDVRVQVITDDGP